MRYGWMALVLALAGCDDGDGGVDSAADAARDQAVVDATADAAPDQGAGGGGGMGGMGGMGGGGMGGGGMGGGGMGGGGMGGAMALGTCDAPFDLAAMAEAVDGDSRVTERTRGGTVHVGSCAGDGAEAVFRFVPPEPGTWAFTTTDDATAIDSVLYVRTACADAGSELACNDDQPGGGITSVVGVALETQPVFIIVDTFEGAGGDFALRARRVSPPVLETVRASVDGGDLRLTVTGQDPDADVTGFDLQLLDAEGAVIPLGGAEDDRLAGLEFARSVAGEVAFTANALVRGLDSFPNTAGVRLWLRDALDGTSEPLDAELMPIPEVGEGMACDPEGFRERCAAGLVCTRPAEDGADGRCTAPAPPRIVEGVAYREGALGFLRVTAADPNNDTVFVVLEYIDAMGRAVPLMPGGAQTETRLELDLAFARRPEFSVRLFLEFDFFAGRDPPPVGARVHFIDSTGLESEPRDVVPEGPRPVAEAGARCDPLEFDDVCAVGLMCDGAGERGVCR